MPAKSKRSKAKRYQMNKKANPPRENTTAAAAPGMLTSAAPKPAAPVQSGKPAGAAVTATASLHSYVPGDLARLGIITGIILVVLIILFFVLG
jgi:hypothetical protein